MEKSSKNYYHSKGSVSINRTPESCSTLLTIFHILVELSRPKLLVYSEDKRELLDQVKKPDEIITVDFNYTPLYDRFIAWHVRSEGPVLHLSITETETLKLCCNTAYYYHTIQGYRIISPDQKREMVELFDFLFDNDIKL